MAVVKKKMPAAPRKKAAPAPRTPPNLFSMGCSFFFFGIMLVSYFNFPH